MVTHDADDRGSTLVGELIALAIVGTALVALLSGLSTSSFGVRLVEHHVSAETVARNQMEAIKAAPTSPTPLRSPTLPWRCRPAITSTSRSRTG